MSLRFPQEHHKLTPGEIKKLALQKSRAVIENLKKAYAARPKGLSDSEEKELLFVMARAKRLQKILEKKFKK